MLLKMDKKQVKTWYFWCKKG